MPQKTGMGYVLVQHMDPTHGSALAEILARITNVPVTEVTDGTVVEPDHVYVIPANTTMSIKGGVLRLVARASGYGQHRPINHFMSSLALDRGDQAVCVILSGTASDGTEGCCAVKAAGGITFAQDESSAKYGSMPRNAVAAGGVDFVMAPADIARELARIGRHPYITRALTQQGKWPEVAEGKELEALLAIVRDATGVDFAHYKQSTMHRRIKRRMVLHQFENFKQYLNYLRSNPQEVDELYRDILIHVTGFFRDPEAFEALRTLVFPSLLEEHESKGLPIRMWVPACSTGEEVYSLAMLLLECIWERARTNPAASATTGELQIFATDISDPAIERARAGIYTEQALVDVSPERMHRFFTHSNGGFQISKTVRDMCVFARQNILKDPPFSKLDFVSCRNLLIYLSPVLQKRVVPMLHYALNPGGYLMLGGSEHLGEYGDYFTLIDKRNKIYQRKRSAARLVNYFSGSDFSPRRLEEPHGEKDQPKLVFVEREVERALLNRFVPASVVVNSDMDVVQFRGKTGAYLEPPPGSPTFSLAKMAREGLLVDLRAAFNRARKDNSPVRKQGVRVRSNGGTREVDLEVIPIRGESPRDHFYVVVFQDAEQRITPSPAGKQRRAKKAEEQSALARERDQALRECKEVHEHLQALIEDHETTLEEFKSANEEVLSANEELQSTNEELETAKEELQSTNEELTTLNEELQNRNTELSVTNNDLLNLFANANMPVIILGADMRIRRFTPPAQKLFNLQPADMGRRIGEIRPNVSIDNLEKMAREAVESSSSQEYEVRETDTGGWYLMRIRPYRTWDNRIDGAVVSLQDITPLKQTLERLRSHADAVIENAREATLVLDGNSRVTVANRAFYQAFGGSPADTEGRVIFELGNGEWNIPRLQSLLEAIASGSSQFEDFELRHDFPNLGPRTMMLNARRLEPLAGRWMIVLSIEDVTEKANRLEALTRQATLLDLAHDAVITRDLNGKIQYWNAGAEELYGWKREEAIGRVVHEFLKTEYPRPLQEVEAELLRNGRWEGEVAQAGRDGEKRIVSSRWILQNGREGAAGIVLSISTDVTARKHSEDALRKLAGRLLKVQDDERRRIARDLHDSTGQRLTAINLSLEMVRSKLQTTSPEYQSLMNCMKWVEESMQEIRTVAQLLHPPTLDEAGLASAIRWLVDGFSSRSNVKVELSVPQKLCRMPGEIELALFRVVQEALNNVHRHSGAKTAKVELEQKLGAVVLRIRDSGKGLPPELISVAGNTKRPLGVGILGMRERLAQFGGTLEIKNVDHGAMVTVEVPVPETESAKASGAGGSRQETAGRKQ